MHTALSKPPAARPYPDLNLGDHIEFDATEEKENGWLLSFVDILTLLLTLFVLLLALNHIARKDPSHTAARTAPAPVKAVVHDRGPPPPPQAPPVPAAKPAASFIIPQDIKDKVDVVATSTDVNLVIKDEVLFDEGSSQLKASGESVLESIARILGQSDYPVSVEGHTDNVPIHTAQFPSNWELSTFRATTVTRYFIEHGIAVDRLRAVGYADTRPIADNDTAAGRARNRRVSLVVHVNKAADGTPPGAKTPTPRQTQAKIN